MGLYLTQKRLHRQPFCAHAVQLRVNMKANREAADDFRMQSRDESSSQTMFELVPAHFIEGVEIGEDDADNRPSFKPTQDVGVARGRRNRFERRRPNRREVRAAALVQRHEHHHQRAIGPIDAVPMTDQAGPEQFFAEHVGIRTFDRALASHRRLLRRPPRTEARGLGREDTGHHVRSRRIQAALRQPFSLQSHSYLRSLRSDGSQNARTMRRATMSDGSPA